MKLKSVIFPFNKVLFELDSDHTAEQDVKITSSCLKLHSHLKTDCLLLCNKNFIIMHNNLHTNHKITDQFSCSGNLYVLTLLTQGEAYLQSNKSDAEPSYSQIDQGRLGISSCRNLARTIRMEANQNITYYSILIDKRFLHNLVKKNLLIQQQSFLISRLKQTSSFNHFTLPVCNEVLKAIEFLIQPSFSTPSYLHYLQLKLLEIFLLLENQLAHSEHVSAEEQQVSEQTLQAYEWISKNYITNFTIYSLSRKVGINTARLQQEFKQLTGETIRSFVINLKMEYSKSLLQENKHSIYEISEMIGYNSASHFVHRFKAHFGITPKKYVMNQKGLYSS